MMHPYNGSDTTAISQISMGFIAQEPGLMIANAVCVSQDDASPLVISSFTLRRPSDDTMDPLLPSERTASNVDDPLLWNEDMLQDANKII